MDGATFPFNNDQHSTRLLKDGLGVNALLKIMLLCFGIHLDAFRDNTQPPLIIGSTVRTLSINSVHNASPHACVA